MSGQPALNWVDRYRLGTSVLMALLGAVVLYRVLSAAPSLPGVLLGGALLAFGLYRLSFYWKRWRGAGGR